MTNYINIGRPNRRYVIKNHVLHTFFFRKHNGDVEFSSTRATIFLTEAGAKKHLRSPFGPLEVCEIKFEASEIFTQPKIQFDSLTEKIQFLIADYLGISSSKVLHYANWGSLGADSLDEVEMIMILEDEFEIEFSDDEAEACTNLHNTLAALAKKGITTC